MYICFKHSIALIVASSFFLCNVFSIYGAELSQILLTDTPKTSKEMEGFMRAALDREYQVDVPNQTDSDGPRRNKKCFNQESILFGMERKRINGGVMKSTGLKLMM